MSKPQWLMRLLESYKTHRRLKAINTATIADRENILMGNAKQDVLSKDPSPFLDDPDMLMLNVNRALSGALDQLRLVCGMFPLRESGGIVYTFHPTIDDSHMVVTPVAVWADPTPLFELPLTSGTPVAVLARMAMIEIGSDIIGSIYDLAGPATLIDNHQHALNTIDECRQSIFDHIGIEANTILVPSQQALDDLLALYENRFKPAPFTMDVIKRVGLIDNKISVVLVKDVMVHHASSDIVITSAEYGRLERGYIFAPYIPIRIKQINDETVTFETVSAHYSKPSNSSYYRKVQLA